MANKKVNHICLFPKLSDYLIYKKHACSTFYAPPSTCIYPWSLLKLNIMIFTSAKA